MRQAIIAAALGILAAASARAGSISAVPAVEDPELVARIGKPIQLELLDDMHAWSAILFAGGQDEVAREYKESYDNLEARVTDQIHPGDLARSRYAFEQLQADALKARYSALQSAGAYDGAFGSYQAAKAVEAATAASSERARRRLGARAQVATAGLTAAPSFAVNASLALERFFDGMDRGEPAPTAPFSSTPRLQFGQPFQFSKPAPPPPSRPPLQARGIQFNLGALVPASFRDPRFDAVRDFLTHHGFEQASVDTLISKSIQQGVNPAVPLAVAMQESSGQTQVVSKAGAVGLMQVMPDMHGASAEQLKNPTLNATIGVSLLKSLYQSFNGDGLLALAGYNAGEYAVRARKAATQYAETSSFVKKVSANYNLLMSLIVVP